MWSVRRPWDMVTTTDIPFLIQLESLKRWVSAGYETAAGDPAARCCMARCRTHGRPVQKTTKERSQVPTVGAKASLCSKRRNEQCFIWTALQMCMKPAANWKNAELWMSQYRGRHFATCGIRLFVPRSLLPARQKCMTPQRGDHSCAQTCTYWIPLKR